MKKNRPWKRSIALLIAALLILSAVPAAMAVSPDWTSLVITLNWIDAENMPQSVIAAPVYEAPGSFWAGLPTMLSPGTVTLTAYSEMHPDWIYYVKTEPYREDVFPSPVGEGIPLDIIPEAYDQLNEMTAFIEIQAVDPYGNTEVYHLYVSTTAQTPVYIDVTP